MRNMGRVKGIFPTPRYGGTSPLTPALLSVCRRARKGRGRSILHLAERRPPRGIICFIMRRENPRHPTRPHAPLRCAGESEAGLAGDADGMKKPPRVSRAACLPV
jgi:hypothetical protein